MTPNPSDIIPRLTEIGAMSEDQKAARCAYDAATEISALLSRIEELEREVKYESDRGDEYFEAAHYEVGGSPRLWEHRAIAAESKLAEARAEALEAAAQMVERMPRLRSVSTAHVKSNGLADFAAAIRALKTGGAK